MLSSTDNAKAWSDVKESLSRPTLWTKLAWRDAVVQFERSRLGLLWMTFQATAWIAAVIFVFSDVIAPFEVYAPYVAIGIVLYNFITVTVTDSSELFIRSRIIIHSHPNPYFSNILRQVFYALIQLAVQSPNIIIVLIFCGWTPSAVTLLFIPGLLIGILMSVALTMLFSMLGLLYGDFRFSMLAIMRLGLFVTPILWIVEGGGWMKTIAAKINPMAHFIDLIRAPILGQVPPVESYLISIVCILIAAAWGWILFVRHRATIPMRL